MVVVVVVVVVSSCTMEQRLEHDVNSSLEQCSAQAAKTNVSAEELTRAGTVAQALTRFVRTRKLDAVAVECFRLLQQTGITGCYALSRLNDLPDAVAGCEGENSDS